jgi:hypothetical protein
MWKKGRLRLDKYRQDPKLPINKTKENELRYLNEMVRKTNTSPQQLLHHLATPPTPN